ncbi:SDR family NAD(P)-dependent oxidoreductase [Aeromicrobium fastidiosum]|uniref:SDR family NAD(P)-dependent oxidoreductase n=1 Tax=Aeromicrobium fastidiosum TaxID=52699 RepID=A0A641ARV6_9ACTN|nr:SDR family NAD(P)-dependent oxidoreductase [Aeromicrobium fastidiosum]KAA1380846.1 SDR family NAD(P)-dependent oxidoreductase [Aeromicrobium fastidiosum]MBP2390474.1 short-subunit dehydrogenase [Aeromicrobium fastidiosum]
MRTDLAGTTVVVTGASGGIGAQAARKLSRRGATVCLLARREDELDEVVGDIRSAGGTAIAYAVDLSDPAATDDVVGRLLVDHPRIDTLVNNAARSIRRPITESLDRMHDYERTMAINYFGAVRLTLGLVPRFVEQGRGHVVISSSMSTQLPIPLFSAYLASKAALESFTRSLSAELGGEGVSTTVVHFPMVRTEMSGRTEIYQAMPMLSADKAADWLVKAVIDRPARVTSLQGAAGELGMALLPGPVTSGMRPLFRGMDRLLARRSGHQDKPR